MWSEFVENLHVIDVAPTVLEVAGIKAPQVVNGVAQKPIEGVNMLYSFNDGAAKSQRTVQYFEMFGNRGIYLDGWMATTRHGRLPWGAGSPGGFEDDPWELYNITEDFSQADDLAAKRPDKVKQLQAAFLLEVKKYNVLPLDDRMAERFDASLRPNPLAGLKKFTYNFFEVDRARIQSSEFLPKGKSTVRVEFTPIEPGAGKPADVKLFVNGKETANGRVARSVPFRYSVEPFDVGRDMCRR